MVARMHRARAHGAGFKVFRNSTKWRLRMDFRYDINSLRAWAVIAVVLYHFEIQGFSSGFVGVDVFFVISGYLMTRILVRGHETSAHEGKRFNVLNFYLARARRIIPALALLSLVLLVLGWLTLTPAEYKTMGSEALFALTFTSNYKYWINPESGGGYFADDELLRWFLHSWSLSVEWQFYLALPLVIGLLWRIKPSRKFLMTALTGLALLSLTASILDTSRDAELAFYSIHTRAWEMLAGGMVFFMRSKFSPSGWLAATLEALGFLLLITSIVLVQPEQQWPGYRALLPVLGTVLVLLADRQNSIWTRTAPVQFLGKISYSTYLWHWPIVVGLDYLGLLSDVSWILIGLTMTLILSVFSYYVSEKPARILIGHRSFWTASAAVSAIALVPASVGALVRVAPNVSTLPFMAQDNAITASNDYNPRRDECTKPGVPGPVCLFGSGEQPAAIALGDSHVLSIVSAVKNALPNERYHVISLSSAGCATLREAKSWNPEARCADYNDWAISKLAEFSDTIPVIIVNRFSSYLFGGNENPRAQQLPLIFYGEEPVDYPTYSLLENYRADQISLLCSLAAKRPTYVVQPIPDIGVDIGKISQRRSRFGLPQEFGVRKVAYDARHRFVRDTINSAAQKCGVRILDPVNDLCDATTCWGHRDGKALYYDDNHLSETGNKLLVPMFQSIWTHEQPDPVVKD